MRRDRFEKRGAAGTFKSEYKIMPSGMPSDSFSSRTEKCIFAAYTKKTAAQIINKIPRNNNPIKSPRKKSEETRCTALPNRGVCTIVNAAALLRNHRLCYPTRHERVCLIPETGIQVRIHIVATTMHTSNIDTDRFQRRLLH